MGTSYQKGWVSIRGKKWYGHFRRAVLDPDTNQPKTVSTPVALGLKSEMTKFQAREKLEREIARLTGQITEDGVIKNGTVTFGWFVRNRYLPLKEADWKEETAKVKKHLIQADLSTNSRISGSKTSTSSFFRSTSTSWPKHDRRKECCRSDPTCGLSLRKRSNKTSFPRILLER